MKATTELAMRSIAQADGEIAPENLEKAIDILKGHTDDEVVLEHVLRRKEVMDLLHIHRRTLDYYPTAAISSASTAAASAPSASPAPPTSSSSKNASTGNERNRAKARRNLER